MISNVWFRLRRLIYFATFGLPHEGCSALCLPCVYRSSPLAEPVNILWMFFLTLFARSVHSGSSVSIKWIRKLRNIAHKYWPSWGRKDSNLTNTNVRRYASMSIIHVLKIILTVSISKEVVCPDDIHVGFKGTQLSVPSLSPARCDRVD